MPTERRHTMGSGGCCICPRCDTEIAHTRGTPCMEEHCPECNAKMVRKGSEHHRLVQARRSGGPRATGDRIEDEGPNTT